MFLAGPSAWTASGTDVDPARTWEAGKHRSITNTSLLEHLRSEEIPHGATKSKSVEGTRSDRFPLAGGDGLSFCPVENVNN
mmetsp:Transcript_39936/g.48407  ORF Transcript_39936/g.48407 Transcript_39936/m.48407 type:complete len:81 (+) Transcript_39936:195-437(+)